MFENMLGVFNLKFFTLSFSAIMYIYCSTLFMLILQKRKRRLDKKFFKTLSNGFKDGTIGNPDDIKNIFSGIFNLTCDIDDSVYCNRIISLLRKYLVLYINKEEETNHLDKANANIINIKNLVTEFIDYYEKQYPYSDLPIAEMNILNDINVFIANNDIDSVKRKINELAGILQVRNDDIKELKSANKWSVPLSIIGLILTVVFGILSYIR